MTQTDTTIDKTQGETSTSFQSVALTQQTHQLYAANTISMVATVLNALILAYVLWPSIEHHIILIWLTMVFLIATARTLLAFTYKKSNSTDKHVLYWMKNFAVGAYLSAATWAFAAIFLFPEHDPARQMFLAFVIGGTAAGAITSLSYIKNIIFTYLLIMMLPLTAQFLLHDSEFGITMGVMLAVYSIYIFSSANRTHRHLKQNISLRIKSIANEQALIEATEIAENANQAKTQFLSHMSHELRTPINAMLGFAQLLDLDIKNEQQKDSLREIMQAGNHLISLINQILDLTKIESGSHDVALDDHALDELMELCITLITPMAENHNIQIINNIQQNEYSVHIDKSHLTQIILNLLSNAIKYNCENGRVAISCKPHDENSLEINVTDSGTGISKQQIETLFTPFIRLPEHKHVEGTGIGLTICKRLIESMNGTIKMNSEPGNGSTVSLIIPLSQSDQKSCPSP